MAWFYLPPEPPDQGVPATQLSPEPRDQGVPAAQLPPDSPDQVVPALQIFHYTLLSEVHALPLDITDAA